MDQAESLLAIDIGRGTQDILVWHPQRPMENCPKMILPSPTSILADRIEAATRKGQHIFLSGTTMGGGPCTAAARRHLAAGLKLFSLEKPAYTFHDNLDRVAAMGILIVDRKPDIEPLVELTMADVDLDAIYRALSLFHVDRPDMVAVCVQDHGFSPDTSNRAFRFNHWTSAIQSGNGLEGLLYQNPPEHLTRMKAVKETAPSAWVMDTGASAILGALQDPWVSMRSREGITIVNIGNEHIVAALVKGNKLWGIYEHHTSLMTPKKLSEHLERFRKGELSNREVFDEMGHGCMVLQGVIEESPFKYLSLTGPNRERFKGLGAHMAAPYGDMMLTGCFGLVEAVKRKKIRKNI